MRISDVITEAQINLDKFNLKVAEYRVRNGFSPPLRLLYAKMGKLGDALIEMKNFALNRERDDREIERMFKELLAKEAVVNEGEDTTGGGQQHEQDIQPD